MENPHPPWNLICKLALKGQSLESLGRQFGLSVDSIQAQLDKSIERIPMSQCVRIRTNAEIRMASDQARNDLVSILQASIDELKASPLPYLDQLTEFRALLDAAAKLFAWPSVSVSRSYSASFQQNPAGYAQVSSPPPQGASSAAPEPVEPPADSTAVNLHLIATTPEMLARLAGRSTD